MAMKNKSQPLSADMGLKGLHKAIEEYKLRNMFNKPMGMPDEYWNRVAEHRIINAVYRKGFGNDL